MKMLKNLVLFIPIVFLMSMTFLSCSKISQKADENASLMKKNEDHPKYFYYYKGQKMVLTLNTQVINIISKNAIVSENYTKFGTVRTHEKTIEVPKVKTQSTSPSSPNQRHSGQLKLSKKTTEQEYLDIITKLNVVDPNTDVYPTFIDPNGIPVGISSLFNVKLKSADDYSTLYQMANNYGATIVRQNEFMPLWYTLSTTGSALDMAALFYQSGYFSNTEPDISTAIPASCPTDSLFGNQWGANNTTQKGGTAGVDIKLCGALDQTRGSGAVINVFVIDQGVDWGHKDFDMSLYPPLNSYDVVSHGSSVIWDSHGTAVAGIIGARENGEGITGVAPWCRLSAVSLPLDDISRPVSMQLADAINWAYSHGADVINNSWVAAQIPSLDDAIANALTYGRSGKGCVIVFSVGNGPYWNDNSRSIEYPANSNPGILAVGAVTNCGTRKELTGCSSDDSLYWYSRFGPQLDVVAPGTLIPTTDRTGALGYDPGDYYQNFGGTSAAAPHVSGIAALILSKNPTLHNYEVCNIIESTAQKMGPYTYANSTGRPNGTWNQEMGYGVVNASAAVAATQQVDVMGILYYGHILNGN